MVREQKNGLWLKFNDYELRFIESYTPQWAPEYDSNNAFTNWDGTVISENYKGTRYSASVTTSAMVEEEAIKLITELKKIVIENYMSSPRSGEVEFSGKVKITNYQKTPVAITDRCRYYKVSFTLTAVALLDSNGGL